MHRWVVVVAPRGDVVRLDERFSEYKDGASLFGMALDGTINDRPVKVTVNGSFVSLAWKEYPTAWSGDVAE